MACSAVRTHPCLDTHKVLYTPMGAMYILQPDSGLSPRHPFLPEGAALFRLDSEDKLGIAGGVFYKFYPSQHPHEGVWTCSARLNKFRELDFDFESSWT